MVVLKYILACLLGSFIGCYGNDTLGTIVAGIKQELRNELLTELRSEVQTEVRAIVKQELNELLSGTAKTHSEDDLVGDHFAVKQWLSALVKDVVRTEVVNTPCDESLPKVITPNKRHSDINTQALAKDNDDADSDITTRQTSTSQVAFSVYLDHIMSNVAHQTTLKFNQELVNDGNFYNPHTGAFTAPVTGVYLFHFEYLGWTTTAEVSLVVDDDIIATAIADHPVNTNYMVKVGSTTLARVQKGQAVYVRTYAKDDATIISTAGDKSSSFFGVLLY